MLPVIISLFLIPVLSGCLLLVLPWKMSRLLVIFSAILISAASVYLFIRQDVPVEVLVPGYIDKVVAGADILLLIFFGWIAFRMKSTITAVLSLVQLGVLSYLLQEKAENHGMQLSIDMLSVFMFLLINVVSGIILVYAGRYINEEPCTVKRKKYFLAIMFGFISVMNLLVCANDLEYFYLFFELTTLASFLLIRFRQHKDAESNALTALWMNQVGGLAILAAIFLIIHNGYGYPGFNHLLAHANSPGILAPVALLCVAALVKGAQMPFSNWLLGAMVAPTPVSALLHSSTMVKIAPFIILRLSPVLHDSPVAMVLSAFTGFVFVVAAISALAQDNFKRILAYSTISLLALMIMMAAIGSQTAIMASLILVLFHGISKSMLFLNAGILEKVFHMKHASEMDKLGETGPFTSFVITIGFMSLLLPPFGAFIGKWMSIESLGTFSGKGKLFSLLAVAAIACGGAVLSLLYLKVMGVLIARSGTRDTVPVEKTGPVYTQTIYMLLLLLFSSFLGFPYLVHALFAPVVTGLSRITINVVFEGLTMYVGNMEMNMIPMLVAFFLFPIAILVSMFIRFNQVDRVKEYACGEKVDYSFSSFYFSIDRATPYFSVIAILFYIALVVMAFV